MYSITSPGRQSSSSITSPGRQSSFDYENILTQVFFHQTQICTKLLQNQRKFSSVLDSTAPEYNGIEHNSFEFVGRKPICSRIETFFP